MRTSAEKAGRDPNKIGLDSWTGAGSGTPDQWRDVIEAWRACGATHITTNTIFERGPVKALKSRKAADHLKAIETYMNAVGDLF